MTSRILGARVIFSTFLAVVFIVGLGNSPLASAKNQGEKNRGAIWTTDIDGRQNVNHYETGDTVYLHGQNFEKVSNGELPYKIWVDPPNSQNGIMVVSGMIHINHKGDIPIQSIWKVPTDADKGPYKVVINESKSDNFSVKIEDKCDGYHAEEVSCAKLAKITPEPGTVINPVSAAAPTLATTIPVTPVSAIPTPEILKPSVLPNAGSTTFPLVMIVFLSLMLIIAVLKGYRAYIISANPINHRILAGLVDIEK